VKTETFCKKKTKSTTQGKTQVAPSVTGEPVTTAAVSNTDQESSDDDPSNRTHFDPLLRLPAVQKLVPLGKSTIWQAVKEERFPAPIKIGVRAVAWRLSDIEAFMKGGAK